MPSHTRHLYPRLTLRSIAKRCVSKGDAATLLQQPGGLVLRDAALRAAPQHEAGREERLDNAPQTPTFNTEFTLEIATIFSSLSSPVHRPCLARVRASSRCELSGGCPFGPGRER